MIRIQRQEQWMPFILLLLPLVVSLACNATAGTNGTPEALPSEVPTTQSYPEELILERNIDFGSGSFIYTDTLAGLADLSSYQAALTLSFDGTRDGQPESWSKTYVMLAANNPLARQWRIETSGASPLFLAEMDGTNYEKSGEEACLANTISENDPLTERLELASFLTGVIGADEAGSETANDVEAKHYTFDELALGQQDLTESTGEMWVASEGGYIVKYVLATKANADFFGDGMEGTLIWDYQVSDVNAPLTFALPDDCPPGLVDAPTLPDASNVVNLGGMLAYETSSSLADVIAFYQEQLPALGWTLQGEPATTEVNAFLTYTKGDKTMTIIVGSSETSTEVSIVVSKTP